jgi:ribosome-binding factor A
MSFAQAIREVVSMAILTELRDPRVRLVTVTGVEVAPDMREAKVRVSVMGSEADQKLTLRGLTASAGYLQSRLADRIEMRYTPRLQFELDEGIKKALEVGKLFDKIEAERQQMPGHAAASEAPSSEADSESDAADDTECVPDPAFQNSDEPPAA